MTLLDGPSFVARALAEIPYFRHEKHVRNAIAKLQKPNNGTPFELDERMNQDAALVVLNEYAKHRANAEQDAA